MGDTVFKVQPQERWTENGWGMETYNRIASMLKPMYPHLGQSQDEAMCLARSATGELSSSLNSKWFGMIVFKALLIQVKF